jgi:hypothetical protein
MLSSRDGREVLDLFGGRGQTGAALFDIVKQDRCRGAGRLGPPQIGTDLGYLQIPLQKQVAG